MKNISMKLIDAIKNNHLEINSIVSQKPDWNIAKEKFNNLFSSLANPKDDVWSDDTFNILKE
jgi:hypothetical protein